jgi:para-aminobenzoate synthetase / 4-amino-4-deoxychorismate lyase
MRSAIITFSARSFSDAPSAAGVWHLVSTVRGRLRDGVGDADLLRAAFPPGSVVGAPKVQALRVVRELEGTAREAYCGAIGLVSPTAGLDLSVAIRTFEVAGGRVWLGAGGGVVSDSTPEAEVAEALAKAAPLAAASGLTIAPRNRSAQSSGVAPWALAEGWERPDPDAGLLETVLVVDGVAKLLGEHLARLRASAEALGLAFPAEVALPPLPPVGRARLRLVLDRDGLRAAVGPAPDVPTAPVVLRPWVLPGGLGAHKWADRRLVDALAADGTTPLFVDLDGTVLEAGYAAVVAQVGETLLTPVRDGRVLPSVTAAAAGAQEVRLTLGDALGREVVHLASALRGLHPATLSRAHEVV